VTPERWRQVQELFHRALEQPPDERDAFVRGAASQDDELGREVLSLLRSHSHGGGYLDRPAWDAVPDLVQDQEPLKAGHAIGKYRVLRELARGGMGVVYHATDEVLGRPVALKSLSSEYTYDRTRRERLVREAKLTAQLNHRAIATVYELIETDDHLYIASEFVPGITLRRELEDGPLPPAHLLGTLAEIASALAAAHAHNIIHRDLKPENIIRRDDGQIKVLDFGLARTTSGTDLPTTTKLTEVGTIPGTPGYMAPEVLNNRPADARSDIFVFGLVGWELATGRHPLGANANSQMARLHDISAGTDPVLAGPLPVPGLERVLRRCASRLPEDRYSSAEALLQDLRALQRTSDQPVHLAPTSRLWWWQFHQAAVSAIVATTPIWAWMVRGWITVPRGAWIFFMVLALATTSVTLRLNLLFTSRVNPEMLPEHHGRHSKWIPWAEGALSLLLLWPAVMINDAHEAWAALFIALGILIAASLVIIEPTTSRGAGLTPAPRARTGTGTR
jgi:serine/threonine protein kinase